PASGWVALRIRLPAFVFAYRSWNRMGRDPAEGSYVVRYEPVAGKSLAELGTLIDNTADMPDITGTLVDLGVRGYLHIKELTEKHLFGLTHSTDYQLDILRKRDDWRELKAHELSYLDALTQSASDDSYSMRISEL